QQPGQGRVHRAPGGQLPDAGVPEPGRDEPLQRQVVVGPVDDLRRDAAPGPGLLEFALPLPAVGPGDEVGPVEHVEPWPVEFGDGVVAAGADHPRVLEHGHRLDDVIRLGIVDEGQVETPLAEAIRSGRIVDRAQDHLDPGILVAEGPQGERHDLGRRRLGDADAHPYALAAFRFLGVGGDRLDLAQSAPGPAADRLARRGRAHLPAATGPVEQRPAQRRLERRDLMRQRRLGIAELGRGPPERAQVRHREDGAQLAEANAAFNRIYRSYMAHFFSLVAVFFTLKCDGRASSGTAVVEEGSVSEEQGPVRLFRFLIYGLVLASSATQYSVVPILPVYAHRLGLTGVQQGMVLGAPGLATLAVSVPAGALSDRFGARRLTLWAGWLMSAAMFAQAMAGSFLFLLVARLGGGVGFCPLLARR